MGGENTKAVVEGCRPHGVRCRDRGRCRWGNWLSESCLIAVCELSRAAVAPPSPRRCSSVRSPLATAERHTALVLFAHKLTVSRSCLYSAQRHAALLRDGHAVAGAFLQVPGHSRSCEVVVSVVTARSGRLVPLALSLQRTFGQRFGEEESSSALLSPLSLHDTVLPACGCALFLSMDHAAVRLLFNVRRYAAP